MVLYESVFQETSVNTPQPTRSVTLSDIKSVSQSDRQTDRQTNTAFHLRENDPLQTSPTSTSTRVRVHQLQQSMVMPLG